MTAEQIIKGDESIAVYLGWKPYHGLNPKFKNSWDTVPYEHVFNIVENRLKFYSSWNWLMAAVEKIEMTTIYSITSDYDNRDEFKGWTVHLFTLWPKDEILGYIEDKRFETKRESIWCAVVEFIKWYNKQNNLK